MWTVSIKTRKAIPGLAKILLAIILMGSIFFAVYVQHSKRVAFALNLDAQIKLPSESAIITMDISSTWQKLSLLAEENAMLGIWKIPGTKTSGGRDSFFYINLLASQDKPNRQLSKIVRQNMWADRLEGSSLHLGQNEDSSIPYTNFDVLGKFMTPYGPMILTMKMIYLPNGSTLAISMISPQSQGAQGGYVIEELAKTLKFIPAGPSRQVMRGWYGAPFSLQIL
jgi:hypothetical protein